MEGARRTPLTLLETQMSDVIGKVDGVEIKKYDVCQVSDDGGKTWLDFATIKDSSDVYFAGRLVRERGGFNGHRVADFRIKDRRDGHTLYPVS